MKRFFVIPALIAVLAFAVAAPAPATGNGAPSGSHYTLNIIGVSKGKKPSMSGTSRHTIFVPLGATGLPANCKIGLVVGAFNVNDGNCFDGDGAQFQLPNPDPDGDGSTVYSVFARALGKPGGSSKTTTCATGPGDDGVFGTSDDEEICSVISLELTRSTGQSQFTNASKYLFYVYADVDGDGDTDRVPLFSDVLRGYLWSYDNQGLRLAQLRFYECVTIVPGALDPNGPQDDSDCFN